MGIGGAVGKPIVDGVLGGEVDATPTAAEEEKGRLSSATTGTKNSSFQQETSSAAMAGEGGMLKMRKIQTRSSSVGSLEEEEITTASTQTLVEEGRDKQRMKTTIGQT